MILLEMIAKILSKLTSGHGAPPLEGATSTARSLVLRGSSLSGSSPLKDSQSEEFSSLVHLDQSPNGPTTQS